MITAKKCKTYWHFTKPNLYPSAKAEARLIEMFNHDELGDPAGTAFVSTGCLGIDGTRYGSYKRVNREDLQGRWYIVEMWDGKPSILLLDTLLDERINAPVQHKYLRLDRRAKLERRRYFLYKQGKMSHSVFLRREKRPYIRSNHEISNA